MTHRARKRFGQNFLHDPTVIQRIVQAINPKPDQNLVEIGPGEGAITLPLLAACKHLEVIELDRDLVQPLAAKAPQGSRIGVHGSAGPRRLSYLVVLGVPTPHVPAVGVVVPRVDRDQLPFDSAEVDSAFCQAGLERDRPLRAVQQSNRPSLLVD